MLRGSSFAEKSCADSLEVWHIETTVTEDIARELDINYLQCEPTNSERAQNGIETTDETKLRAYLSYRSVKSKIKAQLWNDKKREYFWISKLKGHEKENILFVAGSAHISNGKSSNPDPFDNLLIKSGWKVKVLDQRFELEP